MLGGFVLMSVLMMTVMNPPTKSSESDNVQAPGNVIIEAQWADKLDADVDLWVQAPGDVPVGYSNKSGHIFNLLRDDLGKAHDVTDYNYEGRVHARDAWRRVRHQPSCTAPGLSYPVAVKIVASVKGDPTGSAKQLVATTVQLRKEGQEMTALGSASTRAAASSPAASTACSNRYAWPPNDHFGNRLRVAARHLHLSDPAACALARRTLSVGIFVILIAVIYGGSIELLGRPKPLRLEWRGTADAQVLSAMPVENEAIYVWLVMPGATEPCAYVLPLSLEAAQRLQTP